jgi:hypothetical protein
MSREGIASELGGFDGNYSYHYFICTACGAMGKNSPPKV